MGTKNYILIVFFLFTIFKYCFGLSYYLCKEASNITDPFLNVSEKKLDNADLIEFSLITKLASTFPASKVVEEIFYKKRSGNVAGLVFLMTPIYMLVCDDKTDDAILFSTSHADVGLVLFSYGKVLRENGCFKFKENLGPYELNNEDLRLYLLANAGGILLEDFEKFFHLNSKVKLRIENFNIIRRKNNIMYFEFKFESNKYDNVESVFDLFESDLEYKEADLNQRNRILRYYQFLNTEKIFPKILHHENSIFFISKNQRVFILINLLKGDGCGAYIFNNPAGDIEGLYGVEISENESQPQLLAEYEYDSFGNIRKQNGALAETNPLRFSTRYVEPSTNLHYYTYRHYSPKLSKWLKKEPLGERESRNLYAFILNDPVGNFDILGNFKHHGNWGGPNWTGGKEKSWDELEQSERDRLEKETDINKGAPKDARDKCYKAHDICYGKCMLDPDPCNKTKEKLKTCMQLCDLKLSDCLRNALGYGKIPYDQRGIVAEEIKFFGSGKGAIFTLY